MVGNGQIMGSADITELTTPTKSAPGWGRWKVAPHSVDLPTFQNCAGDGLEAAWLCGLGRLLISATKDT